MRLVAYLRVSTGRQADGLSPEEQERKIRRWAKKHRHTIVDVAADLGVSGTLADREGFARALRAVRDREARGLVVVDETRFARDLIVQEQLLAEVWSHGGHVFTVGGKEPIPRDDPDDPTRKLIRQVLGAVSEFDRAMIALRLRNGRRAKAERGGYAYGSPPYGTRSRRGELAPDPSEQETVARILELHRQRLPLRTIAATLDAEGHKPRRAERWSAEAVRRILRRQGARPRRRR